MIGAGREPGRLGCHLRAAMETHQVRDKFMEEILSPPGSPAR